MNVASKILSDLTVYMKYAKYLKDELRRENWEEIVDRNKQMHIRKYPYLINEINEAYEFVLNKKVLPSMRSLQFAGTPIELSPNRIYNCSYIPVDHYKAFPELMYLLLGGTGVGISVQRHHIRKLPKIKLRKETTRRFLIEDSIMGWADAVKVLIKSYLFGGEKLIFDFSEIREKGAELVTTGGKAPGAEPLKICLQKLIAILERKKAGDRLTSIEVHDICCHIANAVLAGGIRRAAIISGFSLSDSVMMKSKLSNIPSKILSQDVDPTNEKQIFCTIEQDGIVYNDVVLKSDDNGVFWDLEQYNSNGTFGWWVCNEQRGRANNSVILERKKIKEKQFKKLWKIVEESGTGEPGVYFTNNKDWFTNPCCEIALRPLSFCNLTEVNVSDVESQADLNERVRVATFLGTLQAGYNDFHYLRSEWKKVAEEDALLGIGLTGIASGEVLKYDLKGAANIVKIENTLTAKRIGIKPAKRTTCVKPSGTSSLVIGSSSGIHAWHNDFYIRRIRVGKNEAIYQYLSIYHPELVEDDVTKAGQAVISIPQKAPENAIIRKDETAIDLLERVKHVTKDWIREGHREGDNTHNVSVTISVKQEDWKPVGDWMWENKDYYNGISVLPYNGGTYKQAPFEDCTEETYDKLLETLTSLDLSKVIEEVDNTDLSGELACVGGACEL